MSWAERLKRVFGIEINRCENGGGALKIIASIEDPEVMTPAPLERANRERRLSARLITSRAS